MVGMVDPGDLQGAGARLLAQPLEIGAVPGRPKPGYCERHWRPDPIVLSTSSKPRSCGLRLGQRSTGYIARARIDPAAGTFRLEMLDDRRSELPRVDDRRQGRFTRYAIFAHRSSSNSVGTGSFDELLRFDHQRGTVGNWCPAA
jgi:carotenoid cleavage dioxygenase-like enzyme